MSPGRLLYLLYHQPRERGVSAWDRWRDPARDRRMRRAAAQLAPLALPAASGLVPVRFLTGERFAHQTLFCADSLEHAAQQTFPFEFFDDGTLQPEQTNLLRRRFPTASIIGAEQSRSAILQFLPETKFPSLHCARRHSPLMRKLLDLRAGRNGPALYLDSDMLFFSAPQELLLWRDDPLGAFHMAELSPGAYVDTPDRLHTDLGRKFPSGVNSGILALNDSRIDWPALEAAAARLGQERLAHPWAEQTLHAWLLAELAARPLPPADYRVCASRADLATPPRVLRHYVFKAKSPYLAGEWRYWMPPSR